MHFLRSSISALLICLSSFSFSQKATYLANSGVLIEAGGSKILIDGLFDNGRGKFATPSSAQLDAMVAGKTPFNNLSIVLVTHAHPDHMSPQLMAKLLFTQKNVSCLATPQAIDSVKSVMDDFSSVQSRLLSFPLSRGWKTYSQGGVSIKAAYFRHPGKANAKIQDIAYIANMGGKKILHLGDADMNPDRFEELKLKYEEFDIAFVPFWYLTGFYGAELVKKYIQAEKIVAIHLPQTVSKQSIAKIKQFVPKAILFENPGQTVTF